MWGSLSTFARAEEPPEPDWLTLLVEAAVSGDREAGLEAAEGWNAGEGRAELDYDELFLLSKLITWEAGSDWLPDTLRLSVGEVALNRVASPEFPDTLEEVVYQDGQFTGVDTYDFQTALLPSRPCAEAALRLLLGERMLRPTVVFEGHKPQGPVHSVFIDMHYGRIYFCESLFPELYEQQEEQAADTPGAEADTEMPGAETETETSGPEPEAGASGSGGSAPDARRGAAAPSPAPSAPRAGDGRPASAPAGEKQMKRPGQLLEQLLTGLRSLFPIATS